MTLETLPVWSTSSLCFQHCSYPGCQNFRQQQAQRSAVPSRSQLEFLCVDSCSFWDVWIYNWHPGRQDCSKQSNDYSTSSARIFNEWRIPPHRESRLYMQNIYCIDIYAYAPLCIFVYTCLNWHALTQLLLFNTQYWSTGQRYYDCQTLHYFFAVQSFYIKIYHYHIDNFHFLIIDATHTHTPETNIARWKMVVGRLCSFWEGRFSGGECCNQALE